MLKSRGEGCQSIVSDFVAKDRRRECEERKEGHLESFTASTISNFVGS